MAVGHPEGHDGEKKEKKEHEMNEKHGIPRPGHSASDRVGVDKWKRVDFTGRGEGRPRGAEPGSDSFSREETQPMEMTAPANPLAEILGRLMPLLPLAERWLEKQVGEQAGPKAESEDSSPLVKEWYTPEEASVLLRLHVQTVMKWCREGKIEASKAGGNERNGRGGSPAKTCPPPALGLTWAENAEKSTFSRYSRKSQGYLLTIRRSPSILPQPAR